MGMATAQMNGNMARLSEEDKKVAHAKNYHELTDDERTSLLLCSKQSRETIKTMRKDIEERNLNALADKPNERRSEAMHKAAKGFAQAEQ